MTTALTLSPAQALNIAQYLKENLHVLGIKEDEITVDIQTVVPLNRSYSTSPTLVRESKRYIVPFNGQFHSYKLILDNHPTSSELFTMVQPIPDIFREGLVVMGGEIYYVKLEDLRRGIVRKSRKLSIPAKRIITYQDFLDGLACTETTDLPSSHYYSSASVAARRAAGPAKATEASGDAKAKQAGPDTSNRPSAVTEADELETELWEADMAFEEQIGSLLRDIDS